MTGQLLFGFGNDVPRFYRCSFVFNNGSKLYFADKSTWAKFHVLFGDEITDYEKFKKLGVDIFSKDFSLSVFSKLLQKSTKIYSLLLDQNIVSGLGNIYVNEVLFEAKIHSFRKADNFSKAEISKLYKSIKSITNKALKYKGTTFSDYRTPSGEKGEFQNYLKVFKRANKPCFNCGTLISRTKIGGRSVFFCPKEQKI